MFQRTLTTIVQQISQSFPALLLTGPRQVGKTTLLRTCADSSRGYVTLDDAEKRYLAQTDPALFVKTFKPPVIIDEVQYAPNLFSYIKMVIDQDRRPGLYWLTGSQKFNLMHGITESLAGRIAIFDLLGLSLAEIEGRAYNTAPFLPTPKWLESAKKNSKSTKSLQEIYNRIWLGSFPYVIDNPVIINREIFYRSYVQTYIQRDVRDVLNITDETSFHRFLVAVAARTGQLINYADLARDSAIDNKTARAWLSILQTSGLVYMLYPYHNNVTKRIIKTPKLYFLDTGLCAYLTRWSSAESLESGAMSGAILETYIFSEILKSYWHNGLEPNFYYYRDTDQREIDLLIDQDGVLYPVEFKKTATPSVVASKNFRVLEKLGKKIGSGAVLCLVEKSVPLSDTVVAIPIGYL